MTQLLTRDQLDHGTDFPDLEDLGDSSNLRCSWRHSICSETVAYRLEFRPLEDEMSGVFETYCPRHYVVVLASLLENHDPLCSVPISEHLKSYGPVEDPIETED